MNYPRTLAIVASSIALVFFWGCGRSNKGADFSSEVQANSAGRLEDFLSGPINVETQGAQYSVYFERKKDIAENMFVREIVGFLNSERSARSTDVLKDISDYQKLRPKDFWALVLAKDREIPIVIYIADSTEKRDQKIKALLGRVQMMSR